MVKKPCNDCGKEINTLTEKMFFQGNTLQNALLEINIDDVVVNKMEKDDLLCVNCGNKVFCRHAVELYKYNQSKLLVEEFEQLLKSGQDWIPVAQAELGIDPLTSTDESGNQNTERITTNNELVRLTALQHDKFKREWNKNGVVQFKNERIAILQRMWGQQVQFIVAFDNLTKEGYRCIAHDEGKEGGQASGGFTGGVNSYFYFQKMDFVR